MLIPIHKTVAEVTARIVDRSRASRQAYLDLMQRQMSALPRRRNLPCANYAHGIAGNNEGEKHLLLARQARANLGIVNAYNDMLSAHQPYGQYPALIKHEAALLGATAQVAGGVPAMCDGITQGLAGMDLSLLSRDVIALATAVSLSHDMFDAVLCLGICDKIVPGLLIGALRFGFLPVVFVPAGPMPTGVSNSEKNRVRQQYAEGKASTEDLFDIERKSYHSPGTCTFYGTANSNQMLVEIMGLQLPGSSFVNPNAPLREGLTRAAVQAALQAVPFHSAQHSTQSLASPLMGVVTEKSLVNALVGLLATGGSTNHTMHLIAIARAAGVMIRWQDMADLSAVVPLIARVYPNGEADINQFHEAGGMAFVIHQLRQAGLLHDDVTTVAGQGLAQYCRVPVQQGDRIIWQDVDLQSRDAAILRPVDSPFQAEGGLRLLQGNLGQAVIKVSAVARERWKVTAPARVFHSQEAVLQAFEMGELNQDCVVVVPGQGPQACGMPELHKLTPSLGVLQERGYRVALVTDGRMSGASGKVPAAIHVSPEAVAGGMIARIRNGDIMVLDAENNRLEVQVPLAELQARLPVVPANAQEGLGRELFANLRAQMSDASSGASFLFSQDTP